MNSSEQQRKDKLIARAKNHPVRKSILIYLETNQRRLIDISGEIDQDMNTTQQHVTILVRAGLVKIDTRTNTIKKA